MNKPEHLRKSISDNTLHGLATMDDQRFVTLMIQTYIVDELSPLVTFSLGDPAFFKLNLEYPIAVWPSPHYICNRVLIAAQQIQWGTSLHRKPPNR